MKIHRIILFIIFVVIFIPMQTFAWDLGIIGIGDKEYLELSRSDTKKILGSLPKVLDKEWKQSIVESKDERESTLYSFLKRSTTFDFWN